MYPIQFTVDAQNRDRDTAIASHHRDERRSKRADECSMHCRTECKDGDARNMP